MTAQPVTSDRPLRLYLIAGEHSGDALGAKLLVALRTQHPGAIEVAGVGGELMAAQGLPSLFPLADVAVMGPLAILRRLGPIVRRVYRTVDAALAFAPDVVVIIDSPEFSHPIARRIRRRRPEIQIVDYVSPTVWAWRPGRARSMRAYVDHVLALLPFEPAAHQRLGGPPCTYVGHPLIEQRARFEAFDPAPLASRLGLDPDRPILVVLPGSRASEVARMMQPFGATVGRLVADGMPVQVLIPMVPHLRETVRQQAAGWGAPVHVIEGEDDKLAAFKLAHAALAASGTVTLELGLAGTPMVVSYIVDPLAARLRFLVRIKVFALANLVHGGEPPPFPELMQENCTPEKLAAALAPLLRGGPELAAQQGALADLPQRLEITRGTPSELAATIVLAHAARRAS